MSYAVSFDIRGDRELRRAFDRSPQTVERELGRTLTSTAYRAEGVAKRKAPVDTGTLRGSINTEPARREGRDLVARVKTTNRYARYQEEGTGIYGPRRQMIRPKTGRLLAWKRNGRWHFARQVRGVKPKRFFKQARDEAVDYITGEMKGALRSITRQLAR